MMFVPKNIDPQVWMLTNAICNGTISKEEMRELELLLDADSSAQDFFVDFLNVNAELSWLISANQHSTMDLGPRPSADAFGTPPVRSPILGFLGNFTDFFNHHSPLSLVLLIAVVAAMFFATAYLISGRNSDQAPADSVYVAQITATKDCQWSTTTFPMDKLTLLKIGTHLQLEKGLVQITYYNKAVVLLEGPISFNVDSAKSGFLNMGKLLARADTEQSRQFTIGTPNAKFVDLGTEFGVNVDAKGRSEVAVFAGKVDAAAKQTDGSWTAPISVRRGEAVVCEGVTFTSQVAQRGDFPSLQPLPPPPPSPFYQRWLDASRELRSRQDLVAYYDFQHDPNNPGVLLNCASTGAIYNGNIQNATWSEGRFPGKNALEFMTEEAGVRVNLPGEYQKMTLIAWLREKKPNIKYNSILMSDGWKINKLLHWGILKSGQVELSVFGQNEGGKSTRLLSVDGLNQWFMIAGTIDIPNQCSLFFNGELFENITFTNIPVIQIGSATIGGWNNQGKGDSVIGESRNFMGRIDELMIFQRVLTPEEIKQIYEAGKP
jgi:hypothetical protein